MCGIAGIFNPNGDAVSQSLLRRMTNTLIHRGPDDEGFYTDAGVGLGHRRLAVMDSSPLGRQPIASGCGQVVIVYNGTIYNFQVLRVELQALGHRFVSIGDAEVLAAAWLEWGEKCIERLNGHFAFAVWDKRERSFFLTRDRYGGKPLYWAVNRGSILFASEHKAILACPNIGREVDEAALLEYFTFQNFFTQRTLIKGINLFPPGSYVRIREGDSTNPACRRYWDFHFREPENNHVDETEYADRLDALLRQAIKRQLTADVEVGAFLSGGIDSGTISAIAAQDIPEMKSFTCGFDLSEAVGHELAFDERVRAEAMSAKFGTEHYEMIIKRGDMERVMSKLAWHIEEPRVGQSYPNFYASKLAGKFVKVALSGAGGDELFGGYPWRYYRSCHNTSFDSYVDDYYVFWQRLVPNRYMPSLLEPVWEKVRDLRTRNIFAEVFSDTQTSITCPEDAINLSLYFEAKTFLQGLLIVDDKLSMAHGLEMRMPFLDNDLVEFAMTCPVRLKLLNLNESIRINENQSGPKKEAFFKRTRDGKVLLRKVASRYVSDEISSAVKQGFSAPDASWFRDGSSGFVRDSILNPKLPMYDFLGYGMVKQLVEEHFSGNENRRLLIWSLLSFHYWLENFMK